MVDFYPIGLDTDARATRERTTGADSPAAAPTAARLTAYQFDTELTTNRNHLPVTFCEIAELYLALGVLFL
jgi:hypothetical protein